MTTARFPLNDGLASPSRSAMIANHPRIALFPPWRAISSAPSETPEAQTQSRATLQDAWPFVCDGFRPLHDRRLWRGCRGVCPKYLGQDRLTRWPEKAENWPLEAGALTSAPLY
jgi:hypothetical protein